MTLTLPLLSILGALCVGAMSPGPSFILVVRVAVAASRRDGLAAALGMGFGGLLFATLALAGLQALLMQVTWLYLVLKALGGAYLLYLGYLIWRGARQPLNAETGGTMTRGFWRSLALGFGTQISNPKTAIYYASVFAAFLPQHPSAAYFWILPPMIFLIEAGWYTLVALAFSADLPRAAYLRAKVWVDRAAATVLGLLGGKLILEAVRAKV
jgi:threonine/homoserine/homoserine lactone efflux protein